MRYLILVGNGFDMAHNLETSYYDFIKDLFDKKIFKDKNSYGDIIDPNSISQEINSLEVLKDCLHKDSCPRFNNDFIKLLIDDMADKKWCDIEEKYFEMLMNCDKTNTIPIKLHNDFDVVKKHLSNYLAEKEKLAKKVNSYEIFFDHLTNSQHSQSEVLILNFNYTKTIQNLYSDVIKCNIVHIHGELESKENPMIFGYATDHEIVDKLSFKNIEYIKNIKTCLYNMAKSKTLLKEFLESSKKAKVNVIILGHSCGLSDKFILNEIFNHESIDKINIFFYEKNNTHNYLNIQENIRKVICDSKKLEALLKNYHLSHRMPQYNDNEDQIMNFTKRIKELESPKPYVSVAFIPLVRG